MKQFKSLSVIRGVMQSNDHGLCPLFLEHRLFTYVSMLTSEELLHCLLYIMICDDKYDVVTVLFFFFFFLSYFRSSGENPV